VLVKLLPLKLSNACSALAWRAALPCRVVAATRPSAAWPASRPSACGRLLALHELPQHLPCVARPIVAFRRSPSVSSTAPSVCTCFLQALCKPLDSPRRSAARRTASYISPKLSSPCIAFFGGYHSAARACIWNGLIERRVIDPRVIQTSPFKVASSAEHCPRRCSNSRDDHIRCLGYACGQTLRSFYIGVRCPLRLIEGHGDYY